MSRPTDQVVGALAAVVADHGWLIASDPTRLRAALSDVLGADAAEHRSALDALVVSAQEGVPAELRAVGRERVANLAPGLVDRLEHWGMSADQAAAVVTAWASLLPEPTDLPARTDPDPEEPGPAPATGGGIGAVPAPHPAPAPAPAAEPTEIPAPMGQSAPAPAPPRAPATAPPPAAEATALPARADASSSEIPASEANDADGADGADTWRAGSRRLMVAGVAAAVLLAGTGAAFVLREEPGGAATDDLESTASNDEADAKGLVLTVQGEPVTNAPRALAAAESDFGTLLKRRQGAATGAPRCYFTTEEGAAGKDEVELDDAVYCGPLLRLDGVTPTAPYLSYALRSTDDGDGMRLRVSAAPDRKTAVPAPRDRGLVRPDGVEPPRLPEPASASTLAAVSGVRPSPVRGSLAMGAKSGAVEVTHLSKVYRYGSGADARSEPANGRLIAFRIGAWPCEDRPCTPLAQLRLKVAVEGKRRTLPSRGTTFVVAVPDKAADVDLVMKRDGVNQTLSLRSAKPGKGNIEVLSRPAAERVVRLDRSPQLSETVSCSNGFEGYDVRDVTVRSASLHFFVFGRRPSSVDRAFLVVDAWYRYVNATRDDVGDRAAFRPEVLVFEADGRAYTARDIDPGPLVEPAFEVPGDLRSGTFIMRGAVTLPTRIEGVTCTETIEPSEVPIRFS